VREPAGSSSRQVHSLQRLTPAGRISLSRNLPTIWHGCCDLHVGMRTRHRTAVVLLLAVILAGCGERFRRETRAESEVVPEGSASGSTSTIVAPGETAPPLAGTAPVTATNADTTTAFTILDSNATAATLEPGSLAGTLPLPDPRSSEVRNPSSPPPAGESVISIERSAPPQPATTQSESIAAGSESAPPSATEPTATAESEPASPNEPAQEESESSEPSPSPAPPESTATSTVSNHL